MKDYEINENFLFSFFKVNENNEVLKDGIYELYSVDGEASGIVLEPNSYGRYVLNSSLDDYILEGDVSLLLPNVVKELISSINSSDDIVTLEEYDFNHYINTYSGNIVYNRNMNIPVILKQIKGDVGYKNQSITFEASLNIYFVFDKNTNEIIERYSYFGLNNLIDDFILGEVGPITSFEQLSEIEYTSNINDNDGEACLNTEYGVIATTNCRVGESYGSTTFYMVPYYVVEAGEVKFEVENLVNGMAKYNASKDKKLEYTVKVKNVGNAASGENVIKSYVPKEVEVIEGKISNGGVYNKNDHTITWNVDYIEIGEVLSVSYEAKAPEEAGGKELIGKSSIQSGQVLTEVYSTNTIVTLDRIVEIIDNPNTGTMVYIANTNIGVPISVLVMFVIALFAVIVVLIKKMKKTQ